jgi:hypothetical protein
MAVVSGHGFLKHLFELGLIPAETRRVVIDAGMNSLPIMYIEKLGTEGLLQLTPQHFEDVQIVLVGQESTD